MAIYHTRVKTFSRANGHTSTAAAAYRAGLLLVEPKGIRHDYRRRGGVLDTRCFAPLNSPDWALEPTELWSQTELAERRKDATVCREFEIALPHELSDEQRSDLVADIARELVGRYSFAIQASIHEPGTEDGLNHHAHLLATTRRMRPEGLKEKTRELDGGPSGRAEIEWVRQMVAERINEHLARAGVDERVDHRTLQAQANDALARGDLLAAARLTRLPTEPVGKNATALRRRGGESTKAERNDDIREANEAGFEELAEAFAREGVLMPLPQAHSHAAALKDRQASQRIATASGGLASLGSPVGMPGPSVLFRTNPGKSDRPDFARAKRVEAARTALFDAARTWFAEFTSSIHDRLVLTTRLLSHQADRVALFVDSALFRADVRELVEGLKQFKADAFRFARSMVAEDQAAHALSEAKTELAQFDEHASKPGPWSRRQWVQRRRRQERAVQMREAVHQASREATGPEAQAEYQRAAMSSGEVLERLSAKMLERYPVEADVEPKVEDEAAPPIVYAEEMQSVRGPRPK